MSKRVFVGLGVLFMVSVVGAVRAQNKPPAQYVTSADAVNFTPLDPKNPGGPNIAVVSGDLQGKGPITLFLRLPKGGLLVPPERRDLRSPLLSGDCEVVGTFHLDQQQTLICDALVAVRGFARLIPVAAGTERRRIRSSPQAGHEALGNVLRIVPIAWQFRREQAIF